MECMSRIFPACLRRTPLLRDRVMECMSRIFPACLRRIDDVPKGIIQTILAAIMPGRRNCGQGIKCLSLEKKGSVGNVIPIVNTLWEAQCRCRIWLTCWYWQPPHKPKSEHSGCTLSGDASTTSTCVRYDNIAYHMILRRRTTVGRQDVSISLQPKPADKKIASQLHRTQYSCGVYRTM